MKLMLYTDKQLLIINGTYTMPTKLSPEQRTAVAHYHSELARYSSGLFASTLVALTFLLLAGLRHPTLWLQIFLYLTLASFVLGLLAYMSIQMISARLTSVTVKEKEARLTKALAIAQIAQQVLFVLGLIGISGFAVEVIILLFPAATTATPASAGTPTQ
jgi:hypothetical protein